MCKHKGKVGRALAEKQAANRIADAGATTNDWILLTVTE
jgi:hypothetical protein